MPSNFQKQIQSVISTKSERATLQTIDGSGITYTQCLRTGLTTTQANYFVSFNLPHEASELASGSTMATEHPEIYQLNVDKIVIAPIPRAYYSEMIDGRSVTVGVPQYGVDDTALSAKTIVSSTYNTLEKKSENALLGKNVSFLFCDEINVPYTGTTDGGAIDKAAQTTWYTASYLDRPPATAYQNLQSTDINSDERAWSGVDLGATIPENFPTTTNQGYNYDIPVGFVALDKGFMVFTHPSIVNNIPWVSGLTYATAEANPTSATTDIWFTTKSKVSFFDLNINFKTSVVCMALPGEFHFTNNPTWNFSENLLEYTLGTNNYDSTYVTEIGLYNKEEELLAVAKLDRAKEKGYVGVLTFTLELDV
jgi:hypothetical protein